MNWKNIKLVDKDASRNWRARYSERRIVEGKDAVDAVVAKWNVLRPLVIARPGSEIFMPVMSVPEYKQKSFNSAKHSQRIIILISVFYFFLSIVYWYFKGGEKSIHIVFSTLLLALYFILDYRLVITHLNRLKERSEFVVFVYKFGRKHALLWAIFAVSFGVVQYVLQQNYGSFESLIYALGLVYGSVNDGEWWRLMAGSFFHSGLPHWIGNAAMLIFIAPIVGVVSRNDGIAVFLLGNVVGSVVALLQANAGFSDYNALVGISGGISAMMGWLVGFSMRYKEDMPQMFAASMLSFFVVSQLLMLMMYPKASIVSHLGGFFFGMAWSMLLTKEGAFNEEDVNML
jgi:membrane associated rhomboid family serine protease